MELIKLVVSLIYQKQTDMKIRTSFESVTIQSVDGKFATVVNNVNGKYEKIRYSPKQQWFESKVGLTGSLMGTQYEGFTQLGSFYSN